MRQHDDSHEPPERAELIPAGLSKQTKDREIQIFLSDLCFSVMHKNLRKGDTTCDLKCDIRH